LSGGFSTIFALHEISEARTKAVALFEEKILLNLTFHEALKRVRFVYVINAFGFGFFCFFFVETQSRLFRHSSEEKVSELWIMSVLWLIGDCFEFSRSRLKL
jgi:hypothetical protein